MDDKNSSTPDATEATASSSRARHARVITFQLAEVAFNDAIIRVILAAIRRLRAPPSCAGPQSRRKLNESGSIALSARLKNAAAGQERGGFVDRAAQFQQPARPQMTLGAENTCLAGTFR